MDEQRADVIIVGGGAAGLAAGGMLAAAGLRTRVLEARGRLGGRIHTRLDPEWPLPIERGAEFIHGLPEELWNIVRHAALSVFEVSGEHWHKKGAELARTDERWERVFEILERLKDLGPEDLSFAQFLDASCPDVDPTVRSLTTHYVEGINAADQHLVSARSLYEAEVDAQRLQGNRVFRIQSGYHRIVDWLRAGPSTRNLDLRLGTIVSGIAWRPGEVRVESRSAVGTPLRPYVAPRAVITLPLGVLQAAPDEPGGVHFLPELSSDKLEALALLRMGSVVKVLLRFDEAFWEREGREDLSFLHLPDEPLPTWWTAMPLQVPILTGWAGGPAATRLSGQDEGAILDQALGTLSRTFAIDRARLDDRLQAWDVADWQTDPFARGAYAYVLPGGIDAPRQLASPVEQTLYFAGEATEDGFAGTVASAIASGYRAAAEVLHDVQQG